MEVDPTRVAEGLTRASDFFSGLLRPDFITRWTDIRAGLVESLSGEQLTSVLTYHVIAGEVDASTAVGLTSATTLEGSDLALSTEGSSLYLNGLTLVVSADMAHAQHPNHPKKHATGHAPQINHGITIKTNANERYASTGETSALFRGLCEKAGVPVQEFVMRQDMGCGSTIGPIVAAGLGARTVDVGIPMWGMHSTFESCGASDLNDAVLVFTQHFSS